MSSQQQSAEGHALGPRAKKLLDFLRKEKVTDELVFTAATAKDAAKAIGSSAYTDTYRMLRAIEKAGFVELKKLGAGEGINVKFLPEPKHAPKAPAARAPRTAGPRTRKRAAPARQMPAALAMSPSERLLREAQSQLELEIKVIDRELKKKQNERDSKVRQLGRLNQVLGKGGQR